MRDTASEAAAWGCAGLLELVHQQVSRWPVCAGALASGARPPGGGVAAVKTRSDRSDAWQVGQPVGE